MKLLKYTDLTNIDGEIVLYVLADCHIGSEYFNEPKLREILDEIIEKPNAYVILNGDLIDNATKASVSFDYNGLTPSASLGLCLQLFKPLADAGKILAMNTGNHEARSKKDVDLDPTQILAQALGIEKTYSDTASVIVIVVDIGHGRKGAFSIFTYHGSGGGVRIGSKANKVEDMAKVIDCDVYCMSHVHTPMSFKEDFLHVDSHAGTIKPSTRQFVISNAFLNYGGYAEQRAYTPNAVTVPKIHLCMTRYQTKGKDTVEKYTYCEV